MVFVITYSMIQKSSTSGLPRLVYDWSLTDEEDFLS